MPTRYALRLSYGLHVDRERTSAELVRLAREAHADEITFMIYCEAFNNGHETLDELREWLALIRPWKQALEQMGVTVNLNPWQTMLHCDRSRRMKPSRCRSYRRWKSARGFYPFA